MSQAKSIRANFTYNTLILVLNMLFPLATFPYTARILGPEGIGKVNFYSSFAANFAIIGSFGISTFGIREIARLRDDPDATRKSFSALAFLNIVFTLCATAFYIALLTYIPRLREEPSLFILGEFNIILGAVSFDWYFNGTEQYSFIAKRSLVFKFISLLLIFTSITSASSYVLYYGITILALSGASIINYAKCTRERLFTSTVSTTAIKHYIKQIFPFFLQAAFISVYFSIHNILLGLFADDRAVGLFTLCLRIEQLGLAFLTSLGVVLFPRMSYLLHTGKTEEYESILKESFSFINILTLGLVVGMALMAPELVYVFGGEQYSEAVTPLLLFCVALVFSSISSFIGSQVLLPNGREKSILWATVAGAIVALSADAVLIREFSFTGCAISFLAVEVCVFFIQFRASRKVLPFSLFRAFNTRGLFALAVMTIVVLTIKRAHMPAVVAIGVAGVVGGGAYVLALATLKVEPIAGLVRTGVQNLLGKNPNEGGR